jgi:energy-coupling factor transporter ATP-binding protein EcfA2
LTSFCAYPAFDLAHDFFSDRPLVVNTTDLVAHLHQPRQVLGQGKVRFRRVEVAYTASFLLTEIEPARPAVIIPTRDQLPLMNHTLNNLAQNEVPRHGNVVVLDDRSRDGQGLRELCTQHGLVPKLVAADPSSTTRLAVALGGIMLASRALAKLLDGLDLSSLGARGWRRRVVSAPQFHENHVLTNTLSFNLLMGRRWPPAAGDLQEAEAICRELGLGELLDRMPSGLNQVVGDTGWRLSHGEQSRLFVARALLQRAELVLLDESFAALDPESLHTALQCVLRQAPTLVVIAHP